jgi:predicted RNA-binding Zn-ribbon protein involved in translation (DUF1610 family)
VRRLRTSLDERAIEDALPRGGLTCRCGHAVAFRAVPVAFDPESWWTAFIGESVPERDAPATKPVQFPCPNCGGALMVDGTTRTPDCRHCSTRAYLPDDLWHSLRPTPKAEPFYLWIDPSYYRDWSEQAARRVRAVALSVVLVMLGLAGACAAGPSLGLFGTQEEGGGTAPWYEAALFSLTFSWMVAWAVGSLVGRWKRPTRPDRLRHGLPRRPDG